MAAMTLQHILVPTDFSTYAEQALDYAITLAQCLQARVTLIHVISPGIWGTGEVTTAPPPGYFEEIEADAQQQIEVALQRVHAAGLEGQPLVVYGAPFERIITVARDQGVDLIVMGTHGRTGLPHLLLGSVAERVVRLAPCPVLVTRGTAPAAEGA
jgi:universal stress protein A